MAADCWKNRNRISTVNYHTVQYYCWIFCVTSIIDGNNGKIKDQTYVLAKEINFVKAWNLGQMLRKTVVYLE